MPNFSCCSLKTEFFQVVRDAIFLTLATYSFKNVNYATFVVVYSSKTLFNPLLVKCSFYESVRRLTLHITDVAKVTGRLNSISGFCIDS